MNDAKIVVSVCVVVIVLYRTLEILRRLTKPMQQKLGNAGLVEKLRGPRLFRQCRAVVIQSIQVCFLAS